MERKRRKLEKEAAEKNIIVANLDADVAFPEDGWRRSLFSLPTIGFSTIYHHFVERSVLVSARQSLGSVSASSADSEIFDSAKGIDKGFQFFQGWTCPENRSLL